jgi:hypothetical protein
VGFPNLFNLNFEISYSAPFLFARQTRRMATPRKQWVCVADARAPAAPARGKTGAAGAAGASPAPVEILRLLHPKTQQLSPFMLVSGHLSELQCVEPPTDDELKDGLSSWFVGDTVVSDGRLTLATRVDPLFLALPHLMRNGTRYSPLAQVLTHPTAMHTRMLAHVDGMAEQLRHVCDVNDKHGPDMVFYRWNEAKTMNWLRRKVQAAMQLFASDPTLAHGAGGGGSRAKGLQFCKNPMSQAGARKKDPAAADCAAWEMGFSIISEYVEQGVEGKLRAALIQNGNILSEAQRSPKKRSVPSSTSTSTSTSSSSSSSSSGGCATTAGASYNRPAASGGLSAKEQLLAIMNQRPAVKAAVGSIHGPAKKKAKIAQKPVPKGQRSVFSFFKKK